MMNRLNTLIKVYSVYNGEIKGLFEELKQRRESDLRPADKFLGAKIEEQWKHIMSEYTESRDALCDFLQLSNAESGNFKQKVIEELIDLQMSAETLLAILGLDEQQRREARRRVIQKNESRGYYRKGEE